MLHIGGLGLRTLGISAHSGAQGLTRYAPSPPPCLGEGSWQVRLRSRQAREAGSVRNPGIPSSGRLACLVGVLVSVPARAPLTRIFNLPGKAFCSWKARTECSPFFFHWQCLGAAFFVLCLGIPVALCTDRKDGMSTNFGVCCFTHSLSFFY